MCTADLQQSLARDGAGVGGEKVQSPVKYPFKMGSMAPTFRTPGGEARVVDSHNFPASKNVAAALLTIKPGGMRELHWHPNASEWQYYIACQGRMGVFTPVGSARTVDVRANDVGFVPAAAVHYVENTRHTDLEVLQMFKANEFVDVSLNNWIRHLPPEMITSHLGFDTTTIQSIPAEKLEFIAGP